MIAETEVVGDIKTESLFLRIIEEASFMGINVELFRNGSGIAHLITRGKLVNLWALPQSEFERGVPTDNYLEEWIEFYKKMHCFPKVIF